MKPKIGIVQNGCFRTWYDCPTDGQNHSCPGILDILYWPNRFYIQYLKTIQSILKVYVLNFQIIDFKRRK